MQLPCMFQETTLPPMSKMCCLTWTQAIPSFVNLSDLLVCMQLQAGSLRTKAVKIRCSSDGFPPYEWLINHQLVRLWADFAHQDPMTTQRHPCRAGFFLTRCACRPSAACEDFPGMQRARTLPGPCSLPIEFTGCLLGPFNITLPGNSEVELLPQGCMSE